MRMVVGLHNPQPKYASTRHNVGAEVVLVLATRSNAKLRRGPSRVRCRIAPVRTGEHRVMLAVPETYMNLSGHPVRELLAYYRGQPPDLLVIHDDIDLPFGRLRLRHGRGHGGHNGVRSIVENLGGTGFWRLKIGLGRPPQRIDPANYVLGRFSPDERSRVDTLLEDAADVVETFITDPDRAQEQAGARRNPE